MEFQPNLTAAVNLLTGLLRAYELHADANPDTSAATLRQDADVIRMTRDDLLQIMGADIKDVDTHGASREWTKSIGLLAEGSSSWKYQTSRDPHLTAEELRKQEQGRQS